MASRITYKMVKGRITESEFAQKQGFKLSAFSGYYHLLGVGNSLIADAKTPKELWEKYNLIRSAWYAGYKSCECELTKGEENNDDMEE